MKRIGSCANFISVSAAGPGTLRPAASRPGCRTAAIELSRSRPYAVLRGGSIARSTHDHAAETAFSSATGGASGEDTPRIKQMRLEAVLLLAKSPLAARKLAQLAYLADATEARTLVRQLNRTYETHGRALRVEQVAGGYRLMTRSALAPWLNKLGHLPAAVRLSTPMMETLAVVAYRQPVSRVNVEAVRGVACGELLRQLMDRDLIRIAGRGEELGRPYLYGTTKRFLQLFGLPNIDALPPIQWQTLQDDPDQDHDVPEHTSLDSTTDELSTSPKESVVSTVVASVLAPSDPHSVAQTMPEMFAPVLPDSDSTATESGSHPTSPSPQTSIPQASIGDDEDEVWDDDDDEELEDDEELDDDWDDEDDDELDEEDDELDDDDDELDDEDEEDDDLDDEELDDVDDDEEDEWQEVDDDDDEEWDDDDEEDDWEEDDEEDDWD